MEEIPEVLTREYLAQEAKYIVDFGNDNLGQLNGKNPPEHSFVEEYYLGMLRRQTIIISDIQTLLENSKHNNHTTLSILCRSLIDDFLTVAYLKTKPNEEENIYGITGKAFKHTIKSLEVLAKSNVNNFGGNFPHYPTQEELDGYKETFKNKVNNKKLFVNGNDFPLKEFMNFATMYEKIDGKLTETTAHSFFLWKEFSDYVHYSTITYLLESNSENEQTYYRNIHHVLMTAVNTIELSFQYFITKYDVEFKIKENIFKYWLKIQSE